MIRTSNRTLNFSKAPLRDSRPSWGRLRIQRRTWDTDDSMISAAHQRRRRVASPRSVSPRLVSPARMTSKMLSLPVDAVWHSARPGGQRYSTVNEVDSIWILGTS